MEDKHHLLEVGSAICQTPHPTPMDQRSERVNLDERPTGHRCETSIVHDDEHDRTKQGTGVQVMYCLSFMIVRNRRTLWAYASRPVASQRRTAAHTVVTVCSARRAATDRSVPPELLTSSHSENCGGCRPCVRAVVPRSRPNFVSNVEAGGRGRARLQLTFAVAAPRPLLSAIRACCHPVVLICLLS